MPMPVSELTENDYLILKYISAFDKVSLSQIREHFKNKIDAVDYRLTLLSEEEEVSENMFLLNSSYICRTVKDTTADFENLPDDGYVFHITPLGKKALQDYSLTNKAKQHQNRKDLIFKVIPIIISFIALIKSFLPELVWLWQSLMR